MGRLAHVTRLALGRSPFGEPLRDENGSFILGPHAYDNDAVGYRQDFDDRGHPQNRSSRTAARRLRKAQNDVLVTVGVVVRKGEERKSKWEKLEEREKFKIIYDENQRGTLLKGEDHILGVLFSWPSISLRRRLMTFSPYFTVPFTSMIAKEWRLFGPPGLVAGLPSQMLSCLPLLFRRDVVDSHADGIAHFHDPWYRTEFDTVGSAIGWRLVATLMRCLELPILVHATLKSLYIVPSTKVLHWKSFIPFSAACPINIPALPHDMTSDAAITLLKSSVQAPLFLYFIHDYLQAKIGYRLYALLRQLLPKPDRPDAISARVADESEDVDDFSIAGVGYPWAIDDDEFEKGRRYFGPKSFFGALRVAFPPVYYVLNKLSGGRIARSRGRLTPVIDRKLRPIVRDQYWDARMDIVPPPPRGSPDDIKLRQRIVHKVFRLLNLDPVEELVDISAWANDVLELKADIRRGRSRPRQSWLGDQGSNSGDEHRSLDIDRHAERVRNLIAEAFRIMPNSDRVTIQASDGQVVMYSGQAPIDTANILDTNDSQTLQASEVPLAALIQGIRDLVPEAEQVQHLEAESEDDQVQSSVSQNRPRRTPSPPSPRPGISRAPSLVDPDITSSPPPPTLRPVRRATETDDSLAAISETLRSEAEALQSPRPAHAELAQPSEPRQESLQQTLEVVEPQRIVRPMGPPETPLAPRKYSQYRVTTLSNHAADTLAWHASALLTSLILWPVEAIWLRSVANWALQNPAMSDMVDPWWAARLGFGVVGQPIHTLGLGVWFGGAHTASARFRYVGSILLCLGLEGIVRGAVWGFGVWRVKRFREKYGWSQF